MYVFIIYMYVCIHIVLIVHIFCSFVSLPKTLKACIVFDCMTSVQDSGWMSVNLRISWLACVCISTLWNKNLLICYMKGRAS